MSAISAGTCAEQGLGFKDAGHHGHRPDLGNRLCWLAWKCGAGFGSAWLVRGWVHFGGQCHVSALMVFFTEPAMEALYIKLELYVVVI